MYIFTVRIKSLRRTCALEATDSNTAVGCILSLLCVAGNAVQSPCLSLFFPNRDIQHVVGSLRGQETLGGDLNRLSQEVTSSTGRLNRAIPVGAYWHATRDFSAARSHIVKKNQLMYLAWFEKRSRPTILVVTRTETDGSHLLFNISEEERSTIFWAYFWPVLAVALSLGWLLWTRLRSPKPTEASPTPALANSNP